MKILLIMDPDLPVPPFHYGGHERLVEMFIKEYSRLGHEVTLLAGPNSVAPAVHCFGKNNENLDKGPLQRSIELVEAWTYLLKHGSQFDLIHNFGRLLYLLPVLNKAVKKIMTYGRDVTPNSIRKINRFPNKDLIFTACSDYCVSTGNVAGEWRTVYNAIDFSKYTFEPLVAEDSPLMFLGRVEKIKGVDTAIEIAKSTGNRLWIAGNIAKEHQDYFNTNVAPHVDGEQITYLGALNDFQKNEYLGKAKGLIFAIEWDEPFGMVMVEAMACGTPVIALCRGSVEEVVEDGITGIKVSNKEEMMRRLPELFKIDRRTCRLRSMARFDVRIIAKHYLTLFDSK